MPEIKKLNSEVRVRQHDFSSKFRKLELGFFNEECQARSNRPLACVEYCGQRYGTILLS